MGYKKALNSRSIEKARTVLGNLNYKYCTTRMNLNIYRCFLDYNRCILDFRVDKNKKIVVFHLKSNDKDKKQKYYTVFYDFEYDCLIWVKQGGFVGYVWDKKALSGYYNSTRKRIVLFLLEKNIGYCKLMLIMPANREYIRK